uniref:HTH HARE-type domain-containing protein n=1 Tax=Chlorobium chlorochromatii (strain CaD3) TaxID=340177 RepID=Q3APV7_CHLCH
MAITFLQMAEKVLEEEKQPLTASEIWQIATEKGYDKLVESKGKTPWATLGARIYVEVRDNPSTDFIPLATRPKRFSLKTQMSILGGKIPETTKAPQLHTPKIEFLEKDLHALMVYYGFYYLKAYLKTISHNKSDKKGFGEWVHPDIVGCYFPYKDWKAEVVEVSSLMGNTAVKLYSFELKRELSIANIRESFFQAVSNSSWANEGYLVAAHIDNDEDFRSELKRLSTAFGIGIIQLDIDDPDSSGIILPANSKDVIDWDTVNKLAGINPDFNDFLKRVRNDMKNQEIRKELYDVVVEKEELKKLFTKKKSSS